MSIEEKIAKILAEGRAKDDLAEEAAKPPAYSQNPDNERNNVDCQDTATGGTSKKANRATKGASAPEANQLKGGTSVKESIDALVNGENLSEEFKAKATTIFEAAVLARVSEELSVLEEEFSNALDERVQEAVNENFLGLVDHIDGYLNHIVENWVEQNELAIESGVKSDIMESFMIGVKGLFEQHYIDVPESELDLVEELSVQVADLEQKLDEEVRSNIELNAALLESQRFDIVSAYTEGLAQTEVDKFIALTEEIAFESIDIFEEKVSVIRENFFSKKSNRLTESMYQTYVPSEVKPLNEDLADSMTAYVSALDRSVN